jgi:hypothetical protein
MSNEPVKQLSKNLPVQGSFFCILAGLFALNMIRAEFASGEPRWIAIVFCLAALTVIYLFISRYWLAPTVTFNQEGVFIKPFRSPAFFVPYKDVTRLQAANHFFEFISNNRHERFDLFYLDAYGAPQKVRFMLHYFRHIFDSQLTLHEFLKYAEKANRDFVFDHTHLPGPHH